MTTFVLPTVVGFIARYNNKTSIILSAISFVCVSLNGLINLIVYLRLVHRQLDHTVTQLPTIYPQPSTIEQKKCRVGMCLNSLSMSASDFSIFDGTNPSSSRMGQFIDEWSFDEELKPDQDIVSSRINSWYNSCFSFRIKKLFEVLKIDPCSSKRKVRLAFMLLARTYHSDERDVNISESSLGTNVEKFKIY